MSQTLTTSILCALCAAVLCACGGSSDSPVAPATTPPPVVVADLPVTVERLTTEPAATNDTADPVAIDSLIVPAPDDSEPKAL